MRSRIALAGIALLVLSGVVLLIGDIGGGDETSGMTVGPLGGSVSAQGVIVDFPEGAVASEAGVSIAVADDDAAGAYPGISSVSEAYVVEVSEPLLKPVRLTVPIQDSVGDAPVYLATRRSEHDAWLLDPADVAAGGATATTAHLSIWQVVKDQSGKAATKLLDGATTAVAEFLRVGGVRAREPRCGPEPPALTLEGDVGLGDPNALIFACLESAGDRIRIRVVNNRAIGMEADLPGGLKVEDLVSPGLSEVIARQILRAFQPSERRITLASAGGMSVTGQPPESPLVVRPSVRGFVLDLAVFAVGQVGGAEGKAIEGTLDFIECTRSATENLGGEPPATASEAMDAASGIARGCISSVGKIAGGGAKSAAKFLAIFYGGMKLGTGLTDSVAELASGGQDASIQVRRAPLSSCPDSEVAIPGGALLIRRVSSNLRCGEVPPLAQEIVTRDDCVEETPGNVQACEAQGYECEIRLTFESSASSIRAVCRNGAAEVQFTQGSTKLETGSSYELRFGSDGMPSAIGPFDIAAGDATPGDAREAFGPPDSAIETPLGCDISWDRLGLEAHFVNYGQSFDTCADDGSRLNDAVITSPIFETTEGLSVGDDKADLVSAYPRASTRGPPGSEFFDGDIPAGDLYSVLLVKSPIGAGGFYTSLRVLVQGEEVTGLQLVALLGGD